MIMGKYSTRRVWIDGIELLPGPSLKVYNHSPDGFAWGYAGSGPSQLALALMLHFKSLDFAAANYQRFKWDIIAQLPKTDFEIPNTVIDDWIAAKLKNAQT